MSKESEKQMEAMLKELGFASEYHQTWMLWRLQASALVDPKEIPESLQSKPASGRVINPWRVRGCELAARKSGLGIHNLSMDLDKDALFHNLTNITKKYFGARTSSSLVFAREGAFWCLFEFTRATRRDAAEGELPRSMATEPHGVGGFKVRIMADGTEGQVVLSDMFGFGYLPFVFVTVPLRFLAEGLGLRAWTEINKKDFKTTSVHELRFPLIAPVLVHLASHGADSARLIALESALAAARGQFSTTVMADVQGFYVRLPADQAELGPGQSEVSFAPLEVLESRERHSRCREIDKLIITGKLHQAWRQAAAQYAQEKDALYLFRRLSLLGIVGNSDASTSGFLPRALALEPDNKLFLSYSIYQALHTVGKAAALESLSHLGELLMGEIRGADHLPCFDVVLPELLGDAWAEENPDKASDCYHRITEKRGDIPRILRKLIELAKGSGRIDAEIRFLHRLAVVERRRSELAKINLRLAELRRQQGVSGDDAVQLALKALKLDRGLIAAGLLAADMLVEKERFEEAIQLLVSLLKDKNLNLQVPAKHRLEATVGRIWCHHLRRPDLAVTRYEMAITYDPSDLDTLRELERIYRQSGFHLELGRILELQFTYFEKSGQSEMLKAIFDELVILYRGHAKEPKRALDLYLRLLATSAIATQELDKLLQWNDVEIDWPDLYTRLLAKLPQVAGGRRRAEFLCRLAEVCRDRLADPAGAIRHLRSAIQEGSIDAGGFLFLIESLQDQKDYLSLVQIYELRMEQVSPAEKQALSLELLALPTELTDAQRDSLAVNVYEFDQTADGPLKKRFQIYQGGDQVDAIMRLLKSVLELKKLTTYQQIAWMRYALALLAECIDERHYVLMSQLYQQILPLSEDQHAVLHEAIAALKTVPDARLLIYFVRELLRAGLLPNLPERGMIRLLAGLDQELAVYHELMSFQATTAGAAANHARTAAALYAKRFGQEQATEKMLARMCILVACAPEDLVQLRSLVERTGHWKLLAKALQKQAEFEDEKQRKFELLQLLGVIFWQKMKDLPRARLAYAAALRFSEEPHKIKQILARLAGEAGDGAQERDLLTAYLTDSGSVVDIAGMTTATARLLALGEDPVAVQRLVLRHVDKAYSKSHWELAGHLAGVLLGNGLISTDLYKVALKAAATAGDTEALIDAWWRGLGCVANKSKMKLYVLETTGIIERANLRHILIDCYKAAFDHNIGERIGPSAKHELTLQYAAMLFDHDKSRPAALKIYTEAYETDPDDYRTWMPLYFLLLELGSPSQRLEHLRAILPKLKLDQRALKSFPLTIESLQVEQRELEREALGGAPAPQPRVPKALVRPPLPFEPRPQAPRSMADSDADMLTGVHQPAPLSLVLDHELAVPPPPERRRTTAAAKANQEDAGQTGTDHRDSREDASRELGWMQQSMQQTRFELADEEGEEPGEEDAEKSRHKNKPIDLPELSGPVYADFSRVASGSDLGGMDSSAEAIGFDLGKAPAGLEAENPVAASFAGSAAVEVGFGLDFNETNAASKQPNLSLVMDPQEALPPFKELVGLAPAAPSELGETSPPILGFIPDTSPAVTLGMADAEPASELPMERAEAQTPLVLAPSLQRPRYDAGTEALGEQQAEYQPSPAPTSEDSVDPTPAPSAAGEVAESPPHEDAPGRTIELGSLIDLGPMTDPLAGAAAREAAPAAKPELELLPVAQPSAAVSAPADPEFEIEHLRVGAPSEVIIGTTKQDEHEKSGVDPGLLPASAEPTSVGLELELDSPAATVGEKGLAHFDLGVVQDVAIDELGSLRAGPSGALEEAAAEPQAVEPRAEQTTVDIESGQPFALELESAPSLAAGDEARSQQPSAEDGAGFPDTNLAQVEVDVSMVGLRADGDHGRAGEGEDVEGSRVPSPPNFPEAAAPTAPGLALATAASSGVRGSPPALKAAPQATPLPGDAGTSSGFMGVPLPLSSTATGSSKILLANVPPAPPAGGPEGLPSEEVSMASLAIAPMTGPKHLTADQTAASSSVLLAAPPSEFTGGATPAHTASGTGSSPSGSSATNPSRENFGVHGDAADDAADWRAAVIKGDFNADLTGRLLQQAFASEIEKHLAIQCVALVAGNCDRLSTWHWRVWRKPEEYGYPLTGKERFPSSLTAPVLHSTLHKFVVAMAPLLVRVYAQRFSVKYIQRRYEMTPAMVERMRKPIAWNAGLLKDAGLHHYADRIQEARYRAYTLPGLGKDIYYDGVHRALYIDEAYYRRVPTSHLFHRILGIIWSVRIHYYVPLALDPQKEFLPVFGALHEVLSKQGLSKLKMQFGPTPGIRKYLTNFDQRPLKALHEKMSLPSEEQVLQLWEAMRIHVYRMQLAETLDVIGLFESMLEKDLLRPHLLKHSEIYQRVPYAKTLIEFVTKLKI